MRLLQLLIYCLLFMAKVRYSVKGGAINGLYFYPKAVQERAFEIGLTDRETVKRKRKRFMTAFYIVMLTALVLIIAVWNRVSDFKPAYLQALLFLEVMNIYDGIVEKHRNAENLALWESFFTGADAPVIFEDISCMAASNDAGGCEMAESCRSRLPENQMHLRKIDGTLLLSKAEHGLFDTVILSAEFADLVSAETVYGMENVKVLYVSGVAE